VFILDPGGLAVVGREETFYGEQPAGYEPRSRLFAGRSFFTVEEVDFAFQEFPKTLEIDPGSRSTRSRTFDLPGEPAALANWLLRFGETADAISYLEAWLAIAPDAEIALAYASVAAISGRAARAADTLRPHLTTDPINIEWHRAYQDASEGVAEREEALHAEYDRLLEERRADPVAHYLRARIEPDPARAHALYAGALRLDPELEYAARGSAYLAISAGEFERAVAVLGDPVGREGASQQAVALYLDALLAAGHDRELAAILEGERTRSPAEVDWDRARQLVLLLVRGDRGDEASAWTDELDGRSEDGAAELAHFLRAHLLYSSARFDELRTLAQRTDFPPGLSAAVAFWTATERGDLQAINRAFEKLTQFERRGFYELILSLAYAREGVSGLSMKWQRSALTHLAGADRGYRVFAELVEGDTPITPGALARISLPPRDKATLLTLLAVRRPEAATLALREADRLNFEPVFPYHFLRRFQPGAGEPSE
jgi:tetratricopeptide (TPR) repeat protein